jgi:hypothetical protein
MEVHGQTGNETERFSGDDGEVRDAGEMIEFHLAQELRQIATSRRDSKALLSRPSLDLALAGNDCRDSLTLPEKHVAAAREEAAISNQNPSIRRQHSPSCPQRVSLAAASYKNVS